MNLRYIFSTSAVAGLLLTISACSKKFLDVEPQGQLTKDQVLVDPGAANNLVTGVYNTLYSGGFDPTTVGFQYYMATDVASDDADKGSIESDFAPAADIDNFTVTANNFILNNLWVGYYKGIARANTALEQLQQATFDAATRTRLIGETRFIRGMYYFNLVRLFGGVPKLTRVPVPSEFNSDEFQTRATASDIYQVILEDLQYGVDSLPEKGDPSTQVGRATKGAAEALLAKVYMYKGDWQKVLDLTGDVMASGKYALVADQGNKLVDYNVIFRQNAVNGVGGNNNSESIFEVQTGLNQNEDGVSPLYSNAQGARGTGGWDDLGFGFNNPSSDLVNAYEPGDTRKAGTIIFITNTGTVLWDGFRLPSQDSVVNQRYNYKGYVSALRESAQASGNKDTKPKNIRLMRYAEVLLMNAEAAVMKGGDALTPLNQVRVRAGLLPLSGVTQQDVWKERRVELAMEQDRFFDLVRQGRAGQVMRAAGKTNFTDGKNEIFPIPQAQIDLSGNRLTQNPNY